MNKERCNSIFYNLLRIHGDREILPTTYVREFFETRRCDHVCDLSTHRDEYAKKITADDPDRLARVLSFKETELDLKIALKASVHYHTRHEKKLVESLTLPSRVWCHTVGNAESAFAFVGMGAGDSMMTVARSTTKAILGAMASRSAAEKATSSKVTMS
jgi:hypothetical protein